jgi:hypothetical protein
MTGEELWALLPDTDAVIMRSLIFAEVQRIRTGNDPGARTLRSLWYSLAKPTLSRMGILDKKTSGGNPVDWPKLLSDHTADLVRDGVTTYQELRIIDGSRQRRPAASVTQTVAAVDLVGAHYPWLIIFTEKNTIWNVVANLARLYGVTAISGSGNPSLACTENVLDAIIEHRAYEARHPIGLLSFTDHDPDGHNIAKAQANQLQDLIGDYCSVYHRRLGLDPDQLSPADRAQNAYTPPGGPKFRKWYRETGGVDGRPLGLELDALSLRRVRRMFAEGIEEWIDISKRQSDLARAFVDLLAWEVLRSELELDDKLTAIMEAAKSGDVWRKLTTTAIPADLFKQAAIEGWDSVDPTATEWEGEPLFDCEDAVRDAMRKALDNKRPNTPPGARRGA